MSSPSEFFDPSLVVIPDSLPVLTPGRHEESDGRANAMEAASWLAAEQWSAAPRTVHPVIGKVAKAAMERACDESDRQQFWALILHSVGTARRCSPILRFRLGRAYSRAMVEIGEDDMPAVWRAVRDAHASFCRPGPVRMRLHRSWRVVRRIPSHLFPRRSPVEQRTLA